MEPRNRFQGMNSASLCSQSWNLFLNVYGTKESIPRNEFRKPKKPDPHRLFKNSSSGFIGWRIHSLESIPGPHKHLKIRALEHRKRAGGKRAGGRGGEEGGKRGGRGGGKRGGREG
jgi:hypothetical protein